MLKSADQPEPGRKRKRLLWALLALTLPVGLLLCALIGTRVRWAGHELTTQWRYVPSATRSAPWANLISTPRRSRGPRWVRRGHLLMVRLGSVRFVAEYFAPQSPTP